MLSNEKITTEQDPFDAEILSLEENPPLLGPVTIKLSSTEINLTISKLLELNEKNTLGEEPLLLEVQGRAIVIVGPSILSDDRSISSSDDLFLIQGKIEKMLAKTAYSFKNIAVVGVIAAEGRTPWLGINHCYAIAKLPDELL